MEVDTAANSTTNFSPDDGSNTALTHAEGLWLLSRRQADKWREDRKVLDAWDRTDWGRMPPVCEVCLHSMTLTNEDAKQSFWDELPALFGLPKWSELETMKTEALK
ncbi:hypothetical protein C8R47DRAFT_1081137 [Mycena vitilis]|nr:hypothetical protein C8R47DRAFT_1081137 [Mycena vitilis]